MLSGRLPRQFLFLFIQIRCRIGCNLSTVFLYAVGYGVVRIIKQELMQPYDVTLQIHRHYAASLRTDVTGSSHGLLRETSLVHNTIFCDVSQQIQNILGIQAGVNIIDGTVKYLGQSIVIGLLRLIFNRLNYFTLSCGTLEIITCGITDTAVSRRLQTV